MVNRLLLSRLGPSLTGAVVGVLAPVLVFLGNPGNMGICVACSGRHIARPLGFHRAAVVQYLRPEIAGFILGSFISALAYREYRPRAGSAPIIRFFLGVFAMIGALIFLGCPWRAYLRLSGGDLNALWGIAGLASGVGIGIGFLWNGFNLGRSAPTAKASGMVMPALSILLLALLLLAPQFGRDAAGLPTGPVFFSKEGPGSMHAPAFIALGVGLLGGWMAQRSRFCTVGALRDLFMLKDPHLFYGIITLVIAAIGTNAALGQFRLGFTGQPVAHTNALWNFLGMLLSGLAFTLAGGCPGRQLIMSGEGDNDAAVFVMGLVVGAGIAHNFGFASVPKGPGPFALAAFATGMIFCLAVGFFNRGRVSA